jgi:hypothetical protein
MWIDQQIVQRCGSIALGSSRMPKYLLTANDENLIN